MLLDRAFQSGHGRAASPVRREVERVRASVEAGWEPGSLPLEYGASDLVPEADGALFERRAAPFAGQEASPEQPD
jgi:hypothetical protein